MQFSTPITIPSSQIKIQPQDNLLFVGSCFAENIGKRFAENGFIATVNPFGVMYNPISILHTLDKLQSTVNSQQSTISTWDVAFFTLGTNHVYREKATGEIVDNCQKRPQQLFQEEILSLEECVSTLERIVRHPQLDHCKQIIFTVSPIRYKKYGFHESQLSKATLLLAIEQIVSKHTIPSHSSAVGMKNTNHSPYQHQEGGGAALYYFPAYEIVLDELRDYRFYSSDMIHPSEQAVDYIFERFRETYFSTETNAFFTEYQPIKQAFNHKPFNPDSKEYKSFLATAQENLKVFHAKWFTE
ncbi:MAG: GSCFA domain-containing protein [Bacteroidaceae bacterium]|nr:GSCFA domain-containing protein [Bacteroidaceae bacterium]